MKKVKRGWRDCAIKSRWTTWLSSPFLTFLSSLELGMMAVIQVKYFFHSTFRHTSTVPPEMISKPMIPRHSIWLTMAEISFGFIVDGFISDFAIYQISTTQSCDRAHGGHCCNVFKYILEYIHYCSVNHVTDRLLWTFAFYSIIQSFFWFGAPSVNRHPSMLWNEYLQH